MEQKLKELLVKDLCARLPYNVKCKVHLDTKGYCLRDEDKYCDDTLECVNCKKQTCTFNKSIGYNFGYFAIEEVKPYLRPMSSMTVEEEYEYHKCKNIISLEICEKEHVEILKSTALCFSRATDWLNAHHFDYRGLISMGIALEAPADMYKE